MDDTCNNDAFNFIYRLSWHVRLIVLIWMVYARQYYFSIFNQYNICIKDPYTWI